MEAIFADPTFVLLALCAIAWVIGHIIKLVIDFVIKPARALIRPRVDFVRNTIKAGLHEFADKPDTPEAFKKLVEEFIKLDENFWNGTRKTVDSTISGLERLAELSRNLINESKMKSSQDSGG